MLYIGILSCSQAWENNPEEVISQRVPRLLVGAYTESFSLETVSFGRKTSTSTMPKTT